MGQWAQGFTQLPFTDEEMGLGEKSHIPGIPRGRPRTQVFRPLAQNTLNQPELDPSTTMNSRSRREGQGRNVDGKGSMDFLGVHRCATAK